MAIWSAKREIEGRSERQRERWIERESDRERETEGSVQQRTRVSPPTLGWLE